MIGFLAGRLAEDEETAVAAHLEKCAVCDRLAAELSDDPEYRRLLGQVARGGAEIQGDDLLAELQGHLHALASYPVPNAATEGDSAMDTIGYVALDANEATTPTSAATRPRLGKFEILQQLGAGGFGIVYLARDTVLKRLVALKLPRSSNLADPDARRRFFREAEALARFDHPNIVPVYEAGEHEGTSFLAVAYCNGPTLDAWRREQGGPIAPRTAALIVLALAEAAEHAHREGILHRDIKPANVLLDTLNSEAKQDPRIVSATSEELPFVPRLTDFGLARLTDEQPGAAAFSGMVVGTPQYMSPEQAAGISERIGPAADVYSLGAVLYELLTNRPPIRGTTSVDTLRRVLVDEPPPPNQLVGRISDDLNAIVIKCLEKSTARRYATAGALAEDVRRYLQGRPTLARPQRMTERSIRWIQRNPQWAGLVGVALAALLVIGSMSVWYAGRLSRAARENRLKDQALAAEKAAVQLQSFYTAVGRIQQRILRRPPGWIWENLDEIRAVAAYAPNEESKQGLRSDLATTLASYDLRRKRVLMEGIDAYCAKWSPDGQRLAVGNNIAKADKVEIHLFAGDPLDHEKTLIFAAPVAAGTASAEPEGIRSLLFSSDGKQLFVGSRRGRIQVWDVERGERIGEWQAHDDRVLSLCLARDDLLISGSKDRTLRYWRLPDGEQLLRIDCDGSIPGIVTINNQVFYGPDRLRRSDLLKQPAANSGLPDSDSSPVALAATPAADGVIALYSRALAVHDARYGVAHEAFVDPRRSSARSTYRHFDVSANGRWLVTSDTEALTLWDYPARRPVAMQAVGGATMISGHFHPHRAELAVLGDYRVELYEVFEAAPFQVSSVGVQRIDNVDLSRNGATLATSHDLLNNESPPKSFRLIHLLDEPWTGRPIALEGGSVGNQRDAGNGGIDISPSGELVAVAEAGSAALRVLGRSGAEKRLQVAPLGEVDWPQFSRDGKRLWFVAEEPAAERANGERVPWMIAAVDLAALAPGNLTNADETTIGSFDLPGFRWVSRQANVEIRRSKMVGLRVGERRVIVASEDHRLRVFDAASGVLEKDIGLKQVMPEDAVLSSDERSAVVADRSGQLHVVDIERGQVAAVVMAHGDVVTSLAQANTGLLVSGAGNGTICFWQMRDLKLTPIFSINAWSTSVKKLAISEDARVLAVLLKDQSTVHMVRLDELHRLFAEYGLGWFPSAGRQ